MRAVMGVHTTFCDEELKNAYLFIMLSGDKLAVVRCAGGRICAYARKLKLAWLLCRVASSRLTFNPRSLLLNFSRVRQSYASPQR